MLDLFVKIEEAAAFIQKRWSCAPRVGIILGTGLGGLAQQIEVEARLAFDEIPHFLHTTATSHAGHLVCGKLQGVSVVAMQGRFHAYEGYPLKLATLPVRVMKALGAKLLIASNACGGLNPHYAAGDIMVMDDHINLMGLNPLIGINDDRLGPRFPDMCEPYDLKLVEKALEIARRENFVCHRGVYAAVTGPNLETRAEYRFLRWIGSDVVGMSTVPEVIVAAHCGMRCMGISIITDLCLADALKPANIEEIVATANGAEWKLRAIVLGILEQEAAAQPPGTA